jgi:phosphate transport system permease protein
MLSLSFKPIDHVLHPGGATLAALIALKFGNASTPFYRQALIAAGLALFALVLIVNMIARLIVVRSSPERRAR